MENRESAERALQDLSDRFRASRINRRELIQRAGLLLGGSALASFLSACGAPSQPAAPTAQASQPAAVPAQQKKGGTLKAAIMSDLPSVDSVYTTATLARNISFHMLEGLFSRDSKFSPKPDLAESYEIAPDAMSCTVTLRKGVTFHNGKTMGTADVLASMKRWMVAGTRGKTIGARLDSIEAKGNDAVVFKFKQPTGQLLFFLAMPEAYIVPEQVANEAGKGQLKQYIGTGPFQFVERVPDRYFRMKRFDNYAARSDPPDGYSGRKTAYLDQIDFIPVPEDSVRAEGIGTGEYHFGEQLTPDVYPNLKANPQVNPVIAKPYQFNVVHFNKKQGMFTDVRMRKAIRDSLDMTPPWKAAWGNEMFYRMSPSIGAPETVWYTEVAKDSYNNPKPDEAKALLKEVGYKGEPIKWLTTKEYAYNYTTTTVMKQELEPFGVQVDMKLSDWATLLATRAKPDQQDIFITGHDAYAHPLTQPFMDPTWPGWWVSPARDKLFNAIFAESDPKKSHDLIDQLELLIADECPYARIGEYFILRGLRKEVVGFLPMADFAFWNVSLG